MGEGNGESGKDRLSVWGKRRKGECALPFVGPWREGRTHWRGNIWRLLRGNHRNCEFPGSQPPRGSWTGRQRELGRVSGRKQKRTRLAGYVANCGAHLWALQFYVCGRVSNVEGRGRRRLQFMRIKGMSVKGGKKRNCSISC